MNSLVTPLHAAALFSLRGLFGNHVDSVVALVAFAMSISVLGSAAWLAYRMRRDRSGL